MLAPGPRPTAPGSGSEFRPWNAQPVAVNTTQQPMANTRRDATRAIIVVALRPATACPTRWVVAAVAPVWTAGAAAALPHQVSARAGRPPAARRGHPAGRCRPTPRG